MKIYLFSSMRFYVVIICAKFLNFKQGTKIIVKQNFISDRHGEKWAEMNPESLQGWKGN